MGNRKYREEKMDAFPLPFVEEVEQTQVLPEGERQGSKGVLAYKHST